MQFIMAKKNKKPQNSASKTLVVDKKPTINKDEDLDDDSADVSDDSELPPMEQWSEQARALHNALQGGKFAAAIDAAKKQGNMEDDFEEADLDENSSVENNDTPGDAGEDGSSDSIAASDDEGGSFSESEKEDVGQGAGAMKLTIKDEPSSSIGKQDSLSDDDDETDNGKHEASAKALQVVTSQMVSVQAKLPWPERFDVVPSTPLPFGNGDNDDHGDNVVNVHDDLQREVAFYDLALAAAHEARQRCQAHDVPFERPADFFAEMVKTDDHMAKVKDRLIFEKKKIEAVATRKANKEGKLRVKEALANKQDEKAARKRQHMATVHDWASSSRKGGALDENAERSWMERLNSRGGGTGSEKSKKRQRADKKYGYGGKRGRFKQTDPKKLNDMSDYNPRGNFAAGGMKRNRATTGSGADRPGKRTRDAQRRARSK